MKNNLNLWDVQMSSVERATCSSTLTCQVFRDTVWLIMNVMSTASTTSHDCDVTGLPMKQLKEVFSDWFRLLFCIACHNMSSCCIWMLFLSSIAFRRALFFPTHLYCTWQSAYQMLKCSSRLETGKEDILQSMQPFNILPDYTYGHIRIATSHG